MWDENDSFNDSGVGFMRFDEDTASPSQSRTPSEKEPRRVVSVNVNILNKYYNVEHGLIIHDQKVFAVNIVGRVESLSQYTTFSLFMLRDDCGPAIEVKFWTLDDKKDNATAGSSIVENSLVRVHGEVRSKEGQAFISAFRIAPVKEINEMAIHNLEVMYQLKVMEKLKHNRITVPYVAEMNDHEITNGTIWGLNQTLQTLLSQIASGDAPEGISFKELVSTSHSMNEQSIRENLNFLIHEGHVYATIDDDHFKSTHAK
ncbi:replication protein A 32 kDa subunit-like protein [Leptotrombidium deliense]|uniref:Replication protein A 32 kDa subunit-like protein n=1 Tax=Leptotrombidium deliense TaxID=299467 RepID=A0A443SG19_9ACAR|nr:replication protein A 32 kDa subunit-like protein [Leptotrombidium deliense]